MQQNILYQKLTETLSQYKKSALKLQKFFKSLESRVDSFALPHELLEGKRREIKNYCQHLITRQTTVSDFLTQMKDQLNAPIPENMHTKLETSLFQFHGLQERAKELQRQSKAAKAGGAVNITPYTTPSGYGSTPAPGGYRQPQQQQPPQQQQQQQQQQQPYQQTQPAFAAAAANPQYTAQQQQQVYQQQQQQPQQQQSQQYQQQQQQQQQYSAAGGYDAVAATRQAQAELVAERAAQTQRAAQAAQAHRNQQEQMRQHQSMMQGGRLPPGRGNGSSTMQQRYGPVAPSWELEAYKHVVGDGPGAEKRKPHTLFPLPAPEVMNEPMFLNPPMLNQRIQESIAATLPPADGSKYEPRKRNAVGPGVHKAISDGVEGWLGDIMKQVSVLCTHRHTAREQYAIEETSYPRVQIGLQNQCAKQLAMREKRDRELRIEMRKRKGGLSDADKAAMDQKKQAETDEATKRKQDENASLFFKRKNPVKSATAFELPAVMKREAKWTKGASCIIYIKKEPGTEHNGARGAGKLAPPVMKTRISTEDLVCFLENNPMLKKSKRAFAFFASRGSGKTDAKR
jgi:hypothetical protein